MSTAAAKKNAHIVEYVLYVWQMEDLVRAAQFSETAIEGLFNGEGGADCDWLLKLNTQMQREKLEEKGHISDVLEVQTELALLHDLGGLLSVRSHAAPLLIVVLNNDGGGIFSFLPIAEQANDLPFEELFRTPHGLTLRRAADLFELPFERVEREDRLEEIVKAWLESGPSGPRIVEVPIDREGHVSRFRSLVKEAGRIAREGLTP